MKPPNLLFVFPDQMRAQAMGWMGQEPVQTPVLDRFATESLVLDEAAANYPVCSPYRGMLMSGQYPHASRVTQNCTHVTARLGVELPTNHRCWSDVLKNNGYNLGYIGKWHLDGPHEPYIDCYNNRGELKWNEWCPPERRHGFDYWYAYGTYDWHLRPMYWRGDAPRDGFHFVDQWGPEHEADMAIRFLRNEDGSYRDPDRPFGLVVSMNPPHGPYDHVPEKYPRLYDHLTDEDLFSRPNIPPAGTEGGDHYRRHIRNYYGAITGVDEQFGRILQTLEEQGLAENTIVIFTADHGNCLGINGELQKNNPYEESMRVPFMIRWPNHIAPRHDNLLLSTPDLYPTLLDLMGLGAQVPPEVQGVSHAPLFIQGNGARPASQLYIKIPVGEPAFGWRGVRTGTHTLAVREMPDEKRETLLFDRSRDPYQLHNIAPESPDLVATLWEETTRWLKLTDDPWLSRTGSA